MEIAAGLILSLIGIAGLFALGKYFAGNSYLALQLRYQPATLVMALGLFGVSWWISGRDPVLAPGDVSTVATEVSWLGYPQNSTWSSIGPQFALIAFLVTTVVVYLQVLKGKSRAGLGTAIALSLPLSVMNALTEEIIFRAIPVQLLWPATGVVAVALTSAALFGLPHYFGTPGKIPGVFMAGFLGYVAALSVIDTHGLAVAWLIHFVQDVPIITMLILADRTKNAEWR